jgi:hypothetical protein
MKAWAAPIEAGLGSEIARSARRRGSCVMDSVLARGCVRPGLSGNFRARYIQNDITDAGPFASIRA